MLRHELTGKKFGRLIVVKKLPYDPKKNAALWLCKCSCRAKVAVAAGSLISGRTQSCGCLHKDIHTKHGKAIPGNRSGEYRSWDGMMQRCNNPNANQFEDYGGRGIKICARWHNFKNFLIDMGKRPIGKSINRKKNNKGYYKSNCEWSTRKEQQNNRRQQPND